MKKFKLTPVQFVLASFAGVILTGAVLLMLPFSSRSYTFTDPITALFTATSATCVTGLVVVDTYNYWSFFGQLIILLLIQVGGLGYMTIATFVLIGLRRRVALRERVVLKEGLNVPHLRKIILFAEVVFYTVIIMEGLGAIFLFIRFARMFPLYRAIWASIFHSVSAFCNAGFDVMGDFVSLTPFVNDPIVNITVMLLIVVGGIGFLTIRELIELSLARLRGDNVKKLSLHTKIVIRTTGILIVFSALLIFLIEYRNPNTLAKLPFYGKVLASFFQSITPRTAGFNTVDIASLNQPTLLLLIILMFIGGSPGGTAGGIKTTTFTVLVFLIINAYRERAPIVVSGRTLPLKTIRKAIFIFGFALTLILISTFLILVNQGREFSFLQVLFEVTSAFGTVGLTTGITSHLSIFSRLIIILTMFIGRVGPLTIMVSFSVRKTRAMPQFPEEDIAVG
ncbi:TrkH family potassium uptake protein [Caldisericum exile]|uniref:Ktr system potassium uptake protein KtrB n=1 Tax=Caldisericum exile (strain DSM 21853 / NBRC 104410 / AZM16c01) TaxID=511051 RepID=A0A7U6GDP4_CALEA|nr:TrkH family potassium uptake protein [Caldisericum exile]BAL80507.1 Ktr system potassium uptake protein KtrB [Caldisericum exile AZM16c01]